MENPEEDAPGRPRPLWLQAVHGMSARNQKTAATDALKRFLCGFGSG